jgi:hypothetical protein
MAIMENRRRESALSKRSIGDEVVDGVCYLGGTCQGLCRGDLDHPRDPDAFFEPLWANLSIRLGASQTRQFRCNRVTH